MCGECVSDKRTFSDDIVLTRLSEQDLHALSKRDSTSVRI
jgi:hypothetical protein